MTIFLEKLLSETTNSHIDQMFNNRIYCLKVKKMKAEITLTNKSTEAELSNLIKLKLFHKNTNPEEWIMVVNF